MTMPSVITNYQKKVTASRVKQTYSQLYQAIKLSEAENGDVKDWDISLSSNGLENTNLVLEKYIIPYFQGINFCDTGITSEVQKKCGSAVSNYGYNYTLNNGVSISIVAGGQAYRPSGIGGFILAVTIDVDGPKGKNILGHDAFYFELNEKGLYPYGLQDNITREDILRGYSYTDSWGESILVACKHLKGEDDSNHYRHGCTPLLMLDGWEIKDDYPW